MNDGYVYSDVLGNDAAGSTVLAYMARAYLHSSSEVWAARIAVGEVVVDDVVAAVDTVLAVGQRLDWHKPPWQEPEAPTDVVVLFDDDDLIAVHKPAGLPTLPGSGYLNNTLLGIVRRMSSSASTASPVHRLDRGTSGIVLFARHAEAARQVQQQWDSHRVHKVYRALVEGVVEADHVVVDARIGPVADVVVGELFVASAAGKASRSTLQVVERRAEHTLLDVQIETGRPHQIRIHAAVIGHPLVHDPVYGVGGIRAPGSTARPGDIGYLLHAHTLTLQHPRTHAPLVLTAPPPAGLRSRQ